MGFRGGLLDKLFASCQATERGLIDDLLSDAAPRFYGASLAPQHRQETLRVYATSMDRRVQRAACEVAATTAEARDLPECTTSRQ